MGNYDEGEGRSPGGKRETDQGKLCTGGTEQGKYVSSSSVSGASGQAERMFPRKSGGEYWEFHKVKSVRFPTSSRHN